MGWTAVDAKDYNYKVRKPKFQLAYKLLAGVQFATILITLANIVYSLITRRTAYFFGSLFYSGVPCYRFSLHHHWHDLFMVLFLTALIIFCSVNSLRETIGKTDQSIIIPIKYLMFNLYAMGSTLLFAANKDFEYTVNFSHTRIFVYFSGYIFYFISALIVLVLKFVEHTEYFDKIVDMDESCRPQKHPAWNYAVYGRKILIIYALEVFFFLFSLFFLYYSYTEKDLFCIVTLTYIIVIVMLLTFLFSYGYSLKLYTTRAYEPDPPKGLFKKKFIHALISIGVFALTYVPLWLVNTFI